MDPTARIPPQMKPIATFVLPFAAVTSLSVATLLCGCDQLGKPSAAEAGAAKIAEVSAKARKLTQRIAMSPEAAAVPAAEGEENPNAGSDRQMLSPTQAAEELRKLAAMARSVGDGEAQRKQSAALSQRLIREAAVLDLVALERIEGRMQVLAATVVSDMAAAQLIALASGPDSLKAAETTVKVTRTALERDQKGLEAVKVSTEEQADRLAAMQAQAMTANGKADEATASAQLLRAEVATSAPSVAQPKMAQATARMHEANALRKDAAMIERDVTADQGIVRAKVAAVEAVQRSNEWLATRLDAAEKALSAASAQTQKAARSANEKREHAMAAMEELAKIAKEEFKPLMDSTMEAFEGTLATKTPTDAATMAICKARLYTLAAKSAALAMQMGALVGAPGSADAQFKRDQDNWTAQAKAALIDARDALSGASTDGAASLLATIQEIADATGVDLTQPAPAPQPEAAPAEAPAAAEPSATGEPASNEPAPPAAEEPGAPEPPSEPSDPSEPNK